MNYYKRHIGDYAAATRHLSMLEHGAYALLLDVYYTHEAPLPADVKQAARKVGARGKDEVAAVEAVLTEFFALEADGWHQKRCDEELAKKAERADFNKAVGALGGRPRKNPRPSPTETGAVQPENPNGFESETQTVSEKNPSHKPLATSHKPLFQDALVEHPEGVPDGTARASPAGVVCLAIRAHGVADANPAHPQLQALLAAGAGVDVFIDAAQSAVAKGKGFGYVLGTVKGRMADAAKTAATELSRPTPAGRTGESYRERDERVARDKVAAFAPGAAAKRPAATAMVLEAETVFPRIDA